MRAAQLQRVSVQTPKTDENGIKSTDEPAQKMMNSIIAMIPIAGIKPSSSIRLNKALALINGTKNASEKITVSKVSHLLGLATASELEACFAGKVEATAQFLEKFDDFFGVNKDWLQFGEGHQFKTHEKMQYKPLDYFERIKFLNPREIIFVRENSELGRTAI